MEFTFELPEDFKTMTVSQLLEYWLIPRKVKHFLRTRKNILVNNTYCHFQENVHAGDKITLTFVDDDYPRPSHRKGNADLVEVLFENEHYIIVNKIAGMKTHPNQPDENNTLLNHLVAYLEKNGTSPYVVHRLDKETSGCIIFAKNPVVLPLLSQLLEEKKIDREYEALATGIISQNHFTITKKIGRDRHDRRKRVIDQKNGKFASTQINVINRELDCTRIHCKLTTGRTHQIRVHMASINHALLGDPLYSNSTPETQSRLYLHACRLSLIDPFTKQKIVVESPTPF